MCRSTKEALFYFVVTPLLLIIFFFWGDMIGKKHREEEAITTGIIEINNLRYSVTSIKEKKWVETTEQINETQK